MLYPTDPAGVRPPRNLTPRPVPALLAIGALALAQVACGAFTGGPSGAPQATNPPPVDGAITVDPKLFGFSLSSETAEAGPVTFVVTNNDFLPHDFKLTGNGLDEQTDRLSPGESDTLTVDLPTGTYSYYCTVEGHKENMSGTFTVR